jgi:Helix-turn-helix domain
MVGLAEFERELIRARTGEGRKRAKERGVRFGRPRKLTLHQREEALRRLAAGETQADVARTYNVDPTTIGQTAPLFHKLLIAQVSSSPPGPTTQFTLCGEFRSWLQRPGGLLV